MAKFDPDFRFDIYKFFHKPLREKDLKEGGRFLERFLQPMQRQFENAFKKIQDLRKLNDPATTPQPRLLKDIVGFTQELDNITSDISDDDLRKLIGLAVPLFKEKGLEVGYRDIVRLFTGKGSRTFGWFAYRMIVGERSVGEEQLGEDAWVISRPGVLGSTPPGNLAALFNFEKKLNDRSIARNDALLHGSANFFSNGALTGSEFYLRLNNGVIEVPRSAIYDFSNDFTIDLFVRTTIPQTSVLFHKSIAGKKIEIIYDSVANEITYELDDSITTISETLSPAADLDDGTFRHLALIVDKTIGQSRLYLDGTEATVGTSISSLGDLTIPEDSFLGGTGVGLGSFVGDLDLFRIALTPLFDLAQPSILVPVNFTEFIEQQLDEFFTDVRVVDEGDLNRTLVLRILNLMRPVSERLRVIYIQFFEDFTSGKGNLVSITPGSSIEDGDLQMIPGSIEISDAANSDQFQNMVLQVRLMITSGTKYGLRFLIQDNSNYYSFRMRSDNMTFELFKVVAGVETQLASPVPIDIFNDTFYVMSINIDFEPGTNSMLLRCMQDRNVIFEIFDSTFFQGTWGIESFDSVVRHSEIEMFLMPLEFDVIEPNFAG